MASRAMPSPWLLLRLRSVHMPLQQQPLTRQVHRLFSQTAARTLPKRSPRAPPPPRTQHPQPQARPQPQPQHQYTSPQDSLRLALLARGTETTLYAAPASPFYPLTCRALGTFCLSWAAFNAWDALLTDHPGLWAGIPMMIGGLCIVMAAAGTWIILSSTRLVARVVAVPSTTPGRAPALLLRVEGRALTPLLRARVATLPFADVQLAARPAEVRNAGVLGGTARTREGLRAQRAESESETAAAAAAAGQSGESEGKRRGGMFGLMRAFHRTLSTFRRVVGREGILPVYTRTGAGRDAWRMWKMDVKDGVLLEDGVPLERLLKIRH